MVGILVIFVLFYSMLRLYLKGEQLEWLNILWFTFYSFSEVVPFLTCIALVIYLKEANRNHEVQLLELYDPGRAPQLLSFAPMLLCLSGILFAYIYVVKPHFKEEFRSGRLLISSGTERPIPLQGGHLWIKDGFKWLHNRPDRVLVLHSESFGSIGGGLSQELGAGALRSLAGDRRVSVSFKGGTWIHGSVNRGVRTKDIRTLLEEGHVFEILFRFNVVVLIWVLSFLGWKIGRSLAGGAFLPLAGIFLHYVLAFNFIRPLGANGSWAVMALVPSLSLLLWFPWLKRCRS